MTENDASEAVSAEDQAAIDAAMNDEVLYDHQSTAANRQSELKRKAAELPMKVD